MRRDYEALGYIAYPSARNYPYRDKNNLTDENEYIRGWNKAKAEREFNRSIGLEE